MPWIRTVKTNAKALLLCFLAKNIPYLLDSLKKTGNRYLEFGVSISKFPD